VAATVPIAVIRQLVKHPLTDAGLAEFLADHAKGERAAH
jgi:transaldolase